MMTIIPVLAYHSPHYPDKQMALQDPLLLKNLPRRWAGRAATVTAVTATAAMMLTGCALSSESEIASSSIQTAASSNPESSLPVSVAVSSVAAAAGSKPVSAVSTETGFNNDKIAPLFIHGDGIGSFGCSSAAPAAFLNEEDAYTIIKDELKRVGINIKNDPVNVIMAIPSFYPTTVSYETGELALDGVDEKNKIAFEYVSDNDVFKYLKMAATGGSLPCKQTAQVLIEKLSETPTDYVIATFYNPHSYVSPRDVDTYFTSQQTAEFKKLDQAEMEKNLRLQVADFIAWLKAEGII